jgi:hypothetical protein
MQLLLDEGARGGGGGDSTSLLVIDADTVTFVVIVVVVAPVVVVVAVVLVSVYFVADLVIFVEVEGGLKDEAGCSFPQSLEILTSAQFQNCSGTPRPDGGIDLQIPRLYFGSKPTGKS